MPGEGGEERRLEHLRIAHLDRQQRIGFFSAHRAEKSVEGIGEALWHARPCPA